MNRQAGRVVARRVLLGVGDQRIPAQRSSLTGHTPGQRVDLSPSRRYPIGIDNESNWQRQEQNRRIALTAPAVYASAVFAYWPIGKPSPHRATVENNYSTPWYPHPDPLVVVTGLSQHLGDPPACPTPILLAVLCGHTGTCPSNGRTDRRQRPERPKVGLH